MAVLESLPLRQQVLTAENSVLNFPHSSRIPPIFRDFSPANRTAENGLWWKGLILIRLFLWSRYEQSEFVKLQRRILSDHKAIVCRMQT
jgi:hypothetical protein